MAQRTIHYLFGIKIAERVALADRERFLLGSIMPDAIEACDKDKSHFKVRTDTYTYLDFEAYRGQYFDLMQQDDLYLGYYMHLVEDAFYRAYICQDGFTMPRCKEEVKLLHNDYHILNSYVVNKYDMHNVLKKDMTAAHEPIGGIAHFLIAESLNKLSEEFEEQTEGATVFLTEDMLDEFLELYLPLAIEEVQSLKKGISILRTSDYVWLRKR